MAQTFGYHAPVPSDLGQKFSIGEMVWIVYENKSEKVMIERLLTNSAIVSLDKTGSNNYDMLMNKTVISYSKLEKIS